VTSATEKDSTLKLEFPGIGASFEGHVAADRRTIDGTWSQGGESLPLLFTRKDAGATTAPPKGVAGIWQGILEGVGLRLQLHVFAVEDGEFTGKLDSLDYRPPHGRLPSSS